MADFEISDGRWGTGSDGSVRAAFRVHLPDGANQEVVVFVDPDTQAQLDLGPDRSLVEASDELTMRARAAIGHLLTTGRVSPELRLTLLDLAGVMEVAHPEHETGTSEEPGLEA